MRDLVELDEYEQHLVRIWREIGSVSTGGMGNSPLEWDAILRWTDRFYRQDKVIYLEKKTIKTLYDKKGNIKGVEEIVESIPAMFSDTALKDWELEIIMQLSREYCHEYHAASADASRPCPKEIILEDIDPIENANAIQEAMMSMFGQKDLTKPEIVPRQ